MGARMKLLTDGATRHWHWSKRKGRGIEWAGCASSAWAGGATRRNGKMGRARSLGPRARVEFSSFLFYFLSLIPFPNFKSKFK
jgi:hypothetical protein